MTQHQRDGYFPLLINNRRRKKLFSSDINKCSLYKWNFTIHFFNGYASM